MMTASIASLGGIRMRGGNQSGWRRFLDEILEPRIHKVEGDCHRHDLPPEVWIELERGRLGP